MTALGEGGTERAAVLIVDQQPTCVAEARVLVMGGMIGCSNGQVARALAAACEY